MTVLVTDTLDDDDEVLWALAEQVSNFLNTNPVFFNLLTRKSQKTGFQRMLLYKQP